MMSKHKLLSPIAIIIGLIVVIAGGAATAVAANNSAPGDPLYGLDTVMESIQVAAASDDASKADAHLAIAKEKLQEMEKLQTDPQAKARIAEAARRVEEHSSKAQVRVNNGKLSAADAAKIKAQLQEVSERKQQALLKTLEQVPEHAKPAVERAMRTSEEAIKRAMEQVDRAVEADR
jgi:hypothetical protein